MEKWCSRILIFRIHFPHSILPHPPPERRAVNMSNSFFSVFNDNAYRMLYRVAKFISVVNLKATNCKILYLVSVNLMRTRKLALPTSFLELMLKIRRRSRKSRKEEIFT